MLVSWEWLAEYVDLTVDHETLATRWALTGLNHESTEIKNGIPVIDLEVTSNRGDCLGHIGIAREASVLLSQTLRIPEANPAEAKTPASSLVQIDNQFAEGCPRYTARLVRGVKVGPSPEWLRSRLEAIGVKSINNVVDVTNYVMFECGQPLHAFDFAQIKGGKVIVRAGQPKEEFVAIDHKKYVLDPSVVVIADAERAIALGGVMGGVDSEVSESTIDVLIEAADFTPLSIRRTARKLKLHSPASHRFERRVDAKQMDWASRRCCELIMQVAGGDLQSGVLESGEIPSQQTSLSLRHERVTQVLGIEVPWETSLDILERLGCSVVKDSTKSSGTALVNPPSFRMDLTREIDLIEEIARIHGYDKIPEDAIVPMVASAKRPVDVMMQSVRNVCCGYGFFETMTPSLIGKTPATSISPWTDSPAMSTLVPLLEGASQLRRSLVPSLLASRLHNQQQSNRDVRLFESSNVYLSTKDALPNEQFTLGLLGAGDVREVIGVIEEIFLRVGGPDFQEKQLSQEVVAWPYLQPDSGVTWTLNGQLVAWAGTVSRSIADGMKLDSLVPIGELSLSALLPHARMVPQLSPIIPFPVIERDLNLIVDESLQWKDLQSVVRNAAGPLCIGVGFQEVYRDNAKDGPGRKRVLFSIQLQSQTETLTSQQADQVIEQVLKATKDKFQATLLDAAPTTKS